MFNRYQVNYPSSNLFVQPLQSLKIITPRCPTFTLISVVASAKHPTASHTSLLTSEDMIL